MGLIQLRGGTSAAWTAANPILALREPGVETDTFKFKFGNGSTAWNSLPYASGSGTGGGVTSNTVVSVDGEMVCFAGTGGNTIKRAVGSGIVRLIAGVPNVVAAPGGALVGDTDAQTLSLKTLMAPRLNNNDYISDMNGNQYLVFGQTTAAVNEVKISNAPTGTGPTVAAQGGDTNVPLNLNSQGTGLVRANGDTVATLTAAQTFTNKRFTPRVSTTASAAAPTINTDNFDVYIATAQTVDITSFTTGLSGTPGSEQPLRIAVTGTAARAISWGTGFESGPTTLPTTTVTTQRLDVGFFFNAASGKWRCFVANSA